MAGCRSLREAERLSEVLPRAARRLLGLLRRLADTTARDALCRISIDELRAVLHRAVHAAWRRKALAPKDLPLAVLVLRRVAYTLLALYRAVSLRSDESHAVRWRDLLERIRDALVALAPDHILALRPRETAAATR